MNYLAKLNQPIPGLQSRPVAGNWVQIESAELNRLGRDHRIDQVVPNHRLGLEEIAPNDLDPRQWSLPRVGARAAWQYGTGRGGPIVAVLDTGLDIRHPDLASNLWINHGEIPDNQKDDDGNGILDDVHGCNAIEGGGDLRDSGEHGTHVAGIIAARGNNGTGITGLNWQGRLMGIKIFDDHGNTDVASVCRGVDYAARHGATLLNCSWGGEIPFNQALYESLRDFPGLVVCSAGNSGSNNDQKPHYPSSFELDHVIAVAATSRRDRLCFTSCYGRESVDLGAPGEQILSTVPGGGYKVKSGTSQATPHVTGVAALLQAQKPQASRGEIKQALLDSAEPLDDLRGKVVSQGILNAAQAVASKGGHGPHLLRDFHRDVLASRQEALEADNRFPDIDLRPGRIDTGNQQTLITPNGLALRELAQDGEPFMLVWLEAGQNGDEMVVDQRGFQRDRQGYYAFPLHLEGSPDKPFDPPDAERIPPAQYQEAVERFEQEWMGQGPEGPRPTKKGPGAETPDPTGTPTH
jgi:hypothetical protein